MKDKFITLLSLTEKKNTDLIIGNLEKLGFFEAPASTRFHLSKQGGLREHSVNVCNEAMALRESLLERHPELSDKLPLQSTIFCALMHDICKAEIYKEGQKWRKDANGQWESYSSYEVDYSSFPVGHGEKSVIRLLQWGLEMTDDEILAPAARPRREIGHPSALLGRGDDTGRDACHPVAHVRLGPSVPKQRRDEQPQCGTGKVPPTHRAADS